MKQADANKETIEKQRRAIDAGRVCTSFTEAKRLFEKEGRTIICQSRFATRNIVRSFKSSGLLMSEGFLKKADASLFWIFERRGEAIEFLESANFPKT